MKYCMSCGKQLDDNAKFCTACGTKCGSAVVNSEETTQEPSVERNNQNPPVEETVQRESGCSNSGSVQQPEPPAQPESILSVQTEPEVSQPQPSQVPPEQQQSSQPEATANHEQSSPSKTKKGKKILLSILAVLLIVGATAGALVYRWYTSTEQQVMRALDQGDYEAALEIVQEDELASENEHLAERLIARALEIQTGFVDGTMEYSAAKMELEAIGRMNIQGVSGELQSVRSYIDKLNGSRTNFATAESFFSTGDYAEAIAYYQQVIEEDANYDTAKAKLSEAVNKYREDMLSKAEGYAEAALYTNAISLLNEALGVLPNDASITEQIRLYEKDHAEQLKAEALSTAAAYAASGDYLSAWKSLKNIANGDAADAEVVSAYNRYVDQYVAQVTAAADEKVAEKDFDGAISTLNAALRELPKNEMLDDKLNEVESKQPIPITTLLAVNINYWGEWNSGSPTDPFGNDYTTACNYMILSGYSLGLNMNIEHYAEYRLYGNYDTLTGQIATHIDSSKDRINRLQIYVDDVLTYTSEDLGRKTDAINFSIDVSGAEYIKIVVYTEAGAKAILANVQLWP